MQKVIFATRHGQSQNNVGNIIGGDCDITNSGREYSRLLYEYFEKKDLLQNLKIYTSQLKRTQQTAKYFENKNKKNFSFLNEIDGGVFENKTYQYVKENFKDEYYKRNLDKFNYRYPEGESYFDLQKRVMLIFNELSKNSDSINLIVCHNAVLRVIYGTLLGISNERIPHIEIPLHSLFKFELINGSYKVTVINFNSKIRVS